QFHEADSWRRGSHGDGQDALDDQNAGALERRRQPSRSHLRRRASRRRRPALLHEFGCAALRPGLRTRAAGLCRVPLGVRIDPDKHHHDGHRGAGIMSSGINDTGEITRTPGTETAVLAGGCFWGMEDLIRRQPGVLDTRVGYTGGENDYATYRNHPGHAEAVEIVFDPTQTSYRDILEFFFQIHDPSTLNRQGNDVGTSYRSAIFPTTPEQEREARETIADVDASGLWPGDVVTASEGACPVEAERAPSLDEWAALVTQCDHGSAGGEALDMRERHVYRRGHGG